MIIKYNKFYFIFLLFVIIFFPTLHISASDKEDYVLLCKKCIDRQEELLEALNRYQRENNEIKKIKIVSEEDYQSFIKLLFENKYINDRTIETENECSYRYNSDDNEIYCIKHGNIKFISDCLKSYEKKKEYENLKTKYILIFSVLGFGYIVYSIIFL